MKTRTDGGQQKLQRLHLIARVQVAYEGLKEAMQRYHDGSPRARAAVDAARRRLRVLNRALAVMALQAAEQAA
jgi:hypothetical protein